MDDVLIRAGQAVAWTQSEELRVTGRASVTAAVQDERAAPTAIGSSQQLAGSPLTPAADGASPRPSNRGARQATFLERMVLTHCLDEEEATMGRPVASRPRGRDAAAVRPDIVRTSHAGTDSVPADAARALTPSGQSAAQATGRVAEVVGRTAAVVGRAGALPVRRESAYKFSPVPTMPEMEANTDDFVSKFMQSIIRTWPQGTGTKARREANAAGEECPGARKDAAKGTGVEVKIWAARIRAVQAFANFLGRTVCRPTSGERPSDDQLDVGVKKFFRCLNDSHPEVINAFLDARRNGLAVAGGGSVLMERTVKDYAAAITFLFVSARVKGTKGRKVVPDCDGPDSPWQKKGLMEREREQQTEREDPGFYIGNPMRTEDIRTTKSAAEKEARQAGQHSTTSAVMTPDYLKQLFDVLVVKHLTTANASSARSADGNPEAAARASTAAPLGPSATAAPGPNAAAPPVAGAAAPQPDVSKSPPPARPPATPEDLSSQSLVETDFLSYFFYVFAFVTLARPLSLLSLQYKDISLPDRLVSTNDHFFNK